MRELFKLNPLAQETLAQVSTRIELTGIHTEHGLDKVTIDSPNFDCAIFEYIYA